MELFRHILVEINYHFSSVSFKDYQLKTPYLPLCQDMKVTKLSKIVSFLRQHQ